MRARALTSSAATGIKPSAKASNDNFLATGRQFKSGGPLLNARAQEPPRDGGRYIVKATGPGLFLGQYASLNPRANLVGGLAGAKQLNEFKKTAAVRAGLNELLGRASGKPANVNYNDAYYGRVLRRYEQLASKRMLPNQPAHFESRHGASTTIEDQWMRANKGIVPGTDGLKVQRRLPPASRFLSNRDQYEVMKQALSKHKENLKNGKSENPVEISMNKVIGEGYIAKSSTLIQTKSALVFFDRSGSIYTAYPDL